MEKYMIMIKLKDSVVEKDLKQLGFESYFSLVEPMPNTLIKQISAECFIALYNREVTKWQSATRNGYFIKFDKEKPVRKIDLIKAGIIDKVEEEKWN